MKWMSYGLKIISNLGFVYNLSLKVILMLNLRYFEKLVIVIYLMVW